MGNFLAVHLPMSKKNYPSPRRATSLNSLTGTGYVAYDKIKMRQDERKIKNKYEVLKKQEEKKQQTKKKVQEDTDAQEVRAAKRRFDISGP